MEPDVELWPSSIVVPPGYPLALPFVHADLGDRPREVFARRYTLRFAPGKMPYVLLPVIPRRG